MDLLGSVLGVSLHGRVHCLERVWMKKVGWSDEDVQSPWSRRLASGRTSGENAHGADSHCWGVKGTHGFGESSRHCW
jgi:hypothetical protein